LVLLSLFWKCFLLLGFFHFLRAADVTFPRKDTLSITLWAKDCHIFRIFCCGEPQRRKLWKKRICNENERVKCQRKLRIKPFHSQFLERRMSQINHSIRDDRLERHCLKNDE
jgi:hypothetical protein